MNALEIRGLTKRFGDTLAVDALELTVAKGELFALLGVNGAGKTTTIKMLCGLSRPSSGDALVFGTSLVGDPFGVRSLVNVSPQETAVAPSLSARENLELMAGIYGARKAEAKRRAAEFVDAFRLGEVAGRMAKTLSGGWQRRLSIAMAMISGPALLFLDEPTLGLDVLARRELWQYVRSLKGKTTIVLTTHYLEEVEALADRVGVMAGGRLAAVGTVAELIAQAGSENFEDAFVALAGAGKAAV